MKSQSQRRAGSTESDTLVTVARTIGSALGTIASKIHKSPKSAPRRRKPLKNRAPRRLRSVSARKARSKRRR
jgi:hypothetical protein